MVHFTTHTRSTATDTVLHAPVDDGRSIPAMVRAACVGHDLANAIYRRDQSGWTGSSSSALWLRVARTASGLRRMGLQAGTCVGILAQPSPDWLVTDLAVQLAGGISVPMFPNAAPETLASSGQDVDVQRDSDGD
jgi:long-chain acyl-CoA synthetase